MTELWTLARLLGTVDRQTFAAEYWEKRPLLVRGKAADAFGGLLTLDDVDRLISEIRSVDHRLRIVKDGTEVDLAGLRQDPIAELNVSELVYDNFRRGATIVLNNVDDRWPPLRSLTSVLSRDLNARVHANVYVTPPGNQGFKPHYDTHDVFVLQANGTKRWRLHGSALHHLPLRNETYDTSSPAPAVREEFDLAEGDVLFIPRGTVHSASANDEVSIHITLGIDPTLWSDVFAEVVNGALGADARFRESLPLTSGSEAEGEVEKGLTQRLTSLWSSVTVEKLSMEATRRVTAVGEPMLRSHLNDLVELDRIGLDTTVAMRVGMRCNTVRTAETLELTFHNKTMSIPIQLEPAVRYLTEANGKPATARKLPARLSDDGRIVLVRRLVREGLLTIVRD